MTLPKSADGRQDSNNLRCKVILGRLVCQMSLLVTILSQEWVKILIRLMALSPCGIVWQTLSGIWVACLITSSISGIYISPQHQRVIAFLMCLSGAHISFLGPKSFNPVRYFSLMLVEFGVAIALLFALDHFADRKQYDRVCYWFVHVTKYCGIILQARIFYILPAMLRHVPIDQRILMSLSILLMLWPQFVHFVTKYITKMRASGPLMQKRLILGQILSAACAFSMNQEHTVISQIFGRYAWEYATFMLIPVQFLMYTFWARPKRG